MWLSNEILLVSALILKIFEAKGTIHLRHMQNFTIFDPYPPTIGIPAKWMAPKAILYFIWLLFVYRFWLTYLQLNWIWLLKENFHLSKQVLTNCYSLGNMIYSVRVLECSEKGDFRFALTSSIVVYCVISVSRVRRNETTIASHSLPFGLWTSNAGPKEHGDGC